VNFIGLNPSTADATEDDPTIRRCVGFAKDWGADGLIMTNLFSYRATDPAKLTETWDVHDPTTDYYLELSAKQSDLVVACWGVTGHLYNRDWNVVRLLKSLAALRCLRVTKDGYPSHPLYLPKTCTPIIWDWQSVPRLTTA
jgi:hypothetical protein